jgi:hypothetical protein
MTPKQHYIVSFRHHSVSNAPEINVFGSLDRAKNVANRSFGDGFRDHELVIYQISTMFPHLVAARRIGERTWLHF